MYLDSMIRKHTYALLLPYLYYLFSSLQSRCCIIPYPASFQIFYLLYITPSIDATIHISKPKRVQLITRNLVFNHFICVKLIFPIKSITIYAYKKSTLLQSSPQAFISIRDWARTETNLLSLITYHPKTFSIILKIKNISLSYHKQIQ